MRRDPLPSTVPKYISLAQFSFIEVGGKLKGLLHFVENGLLQFEYVTAKKVRINASFQALITGEEKNRNLHIIA